MKEKAIRETILAFCKESKNMRNGACVRLLTALSRYGYDIKVDSCEHLMTTIKMKDFVRVWAVGPKTIGVLCDFFNWIEAKEKEETECAPNMHATEEKVATAKGLPMTAHEYASARRTIQREIDWLVEKRSSLDQKYYDEAPKPFTIGTKVRLTLENTPNTFAPCSIKEGDLYTREGYIRDWELNHDNGEFRPDIISKGGKRQHYYFYHPIIKIEEVK